MIQLEILKLALEGAKTKLLKAARHCSMVGAAAIDETKTAVNEYEEIERLIKENEKSVKGA